MLFDMQTLRAIEAGNVTVAFRRWKRPTVRAGGTLKTAVGLLQIDSVEVIADTAVTAEDAGKAGFASIDDLHCALEPRAGTTLHRIRFHLSGPDPRIALRQQSEIRDEDWQELLKRLTRLDAAAKQPWTQTVLELIERYPDRRAGDLAPMLGAEKEAFKINVRKLKNLGLTQSLEVGYRIAPRGVETLARLRRQPK